MMTMIVEVFEEFGLTVWNRKTEALMCEPVKQAKRREPPPPLLPPPLVVEAGGTAVCSEA